MQEYDQVLGYLVMYEDGSIHFLNDEKPRVKTIIDAQNSIPKQSSKLAAGYEVVEVRRKSR